MVFVDTNYFLRFLLEDIDIQFQEAKQLFLKNARGDINLTTSMVVFFEVVWVLRKSFSKDKQALIGALEKVLSLRVELAEGPLLVKSLNLFKKSNLSLEDCYNLVFAKERGVASFKTFDLKLAKAFKTQL